MAVLISVETMYLFFSGRPGADSFGMIGAGSLIMLVVWNGPGHRPAAPAAVRASKPRRLRRANRAWHDVITQYPEAFVTQAGIEVLIF